ncbi:MAG: helix-turn-helix transcriptional regulator, partial [Acutalibacteraceae bacterium]|jgi:transcriptional regulator with XRE-family HTH domain
MLRKASDLTQQQLADMLHIERCTYAFYESGKSYPDLALLLRLARIYNLTADHLIDPDAGLFGAPAVGQRTGTLPEGYKDAFGLSQREQNERQMLVLFRQMDLADQQKALAYLMELSTPPEG